MWEFYLSAVELGFLHGSNMVFQLLLSRQRDAVPIIRDFIVDTERAMTAPIQRGATAGRGIGADQRAGKVSLRCGSGKRKSQRDASTATPAPTNCTTMKAGAWAGAMPEKVSVKERATVTAGLAKDVDEVNQ